MNAHIGISYPTYFPDNLIDDLVLEIKETGANVEVRKETLMFACMDWALPGLISAYLLKPYFESFLNEAGKDHYILLKGWMKKFVTRYKRLPVKIQTATASKHKLTKSTNHQSKAISLYIQCKDGFILKLLFDDNLSTEDWGKAVDDILDIVKEHYSTEVNNRLTQFLQRQRLRGGEVFAIIDPIKKEWVFIGHDDFRNLQRKNNAH